MSARNISKKQNKKRKRRTLFLVVLIVLFFSLIYGAYTTFHLYHALASSYQPLAPVSLDKGQGSQPSHLTAKKGASSIVQKPISILIMGTENYATKGSNGRTDTIILASLNPKTKKIIMTSIPRDSRVQVPTKPGFRKINSAHVWGDINHYGGKTGGGNRLAVKTVEDLFHIPIDYFLNINFSSFVQVINTMNGVDVNVPFNFSQDNHTHTHTYYFKKGIMHLNGKQALAYVRMRKQDPRGDFGREQRQRQVIRAVISKAKSTNTLFKVNQLASIFGNNVKTNLTLKDIYNLQKTYKTINTSTIQTVKLHGSNDWVNNIYYYKLDSNSVSHIGQMFRNQLGVPSKTLSTNLVPTGATVASNN